MKKVFCVFLAFILSLCFSACKTGAPVLQNSKPQKPVYNTDDLYLGKYKINCMNFDASSDNQIVKNSDKKADKLLDEINAFPDSLKPTGSGTIYYVSEKNGDNANDGKTPQTAIKSSTNLPKLHLKEGDVVLFERGGIYRGTFRLTSGVSYGAYGEGDKPALYGARENAAEREWRLTDTPNVYEYRYVVDNVGLIVFDHGQQISVKKFEMEELKNNFDFYSSSSQKLYLYCDEGNPADLFSDIEICSLGNILQGESGTHDVTLQNLQVMYTGSHGFQAVNSKNITIEGCVFGYIGGSVQPGYPGNNVRYGNGIEFWMECDNIKIDTCYVFQCYDDGITNQGMGKDFVESNITYNNNLLEYNSSQFTIFIVDTTQASLMKNIAVTNNIVRYTCYGWGSERPSNTTVSGITTGIATGGQNNRSENFVIKNNIFDRAVRNLVAPSAFKNEWLPTFDANTFIQTEDKQLFGIQDETRDRHKIYRADERGAENIQNILGDKNATVVILPKG